MLCLRLFSIELVYEVCSPHPTQLADDFSAFFGLIPEEEHVLSQFLFRGVSREHGFECIRVIAAVPCFCADGHGSGRKVLYLLQVEIHVACQYSQFCHVLWRAPRVRTDEIGNELLIETRFTVDVVEDALEVVELLERWFAHQVEHVVAGMFRCNFQPP